jgi:hypothetical protein
MISIDDRYWPLVLYRFSGAVSLAELEDYLVRQDEMLARKQMTGSIVMTEHVKMWDTPVLRRQAQWIKANEALLRRYSVGVALMIQSPLVRGMLKALLWIQPMPQPYIVVATADEGLKWLRDRFLALKISIDLPTQI